MDSFFVPSTHINLDGARARRRLYAVFFQYRLVKSKILHPAVDMDFDESHLSLQPACHTEYSRVLRVVRLMCFVIIF